MSSLWLRTLCPVHGTVTHGRVRRYTRFCLGTLRQFDHGALPEVDDDEEDEDYYYGLDQVESPNMDCKMWTAL